jgi:hypothetical protein
MRIVGQVSATNNLKEKLSSTKKFYNDKINAKQAQHKALMDPVHREIADLKKEHGD